MRPPRGGEALSATIPQRQTGGGYVSSAMVAAAARRHTADSLLARGESFISPCVWMEEGSPLMVYSRRQQQALAAAAGYPGGAGHELWFTVAGQRGG